MTAFLLNWLIVSAAVWITAQIMPGIKIDGFGSAIGLAALVGVLNAALGWLLFLVFSIGTIGLAWVFAFITWWVIDAIMLKSADAMMGSVKIDGFGSALMASAVIAIVSGIGRWLIL